LSVLQAEGVTDRVEQLNFLDNMNADFADYVQTLPPKVAGTSAGFIKYLREVKQWMNEDIALVESLAKGLD